MPESLIDLSGLRVGAEALLAAVLETCGQPFWIVDHEDVIRFANPAAATALGYERTEDLAGRARHATIHHRHVDGTVFPARECPLLRPLETGDAVHSELDWFVRRDGSMLPVSYVSVALETPEGRGAVVAFTDMEERRRAADEHAALRRVATLVAEAVSPSELSVAVVAEVGGLLDADLAGMIRYEADGTVTAVATWAAVGQHPEVRGPWSLEGDRLATAIAQTARAAREDDWACVAGPIAAFVRERLGIDSSVGSPVVVEGRVWGALFVHSTRGAPLPADTEDRLAEFTELVATAISNSEARTEVARLANEQAALRRVATLVARGVPPSDLFDAVAEEVAALLGADLAGMIRYENDDTATPVATWAANWHSEVVSPLALLTGAGQLAETIAKTRRPARSDGEDGVAGTVAASIRKALDIRSSVGSPIVVQGRIWGALFVHATHAEPLPPDTENRLQHFTELVATAIANSETRTEVERLAKEQTGLRRVATQVARKAPSREVFAAVGEEIERLLHVENTTILRYGGDKTATVVAASSESDLVVGDNISLEGESVSARVLRTRRPARLDDYSRASGEFGTRLREGGVRSAVGAPIVVEGRLWGAIIASTRQDEPLPTEVEFRVAEFTELLATAISNVQAWADLAASRARIVTAADEERRRVVRDLHDGAQQRLVHTVVVLKLAEREFVRNSEQVPILVREALEHAQRATDELRELSHGILPEALTHGGLDAGLHELASRTQVPIDLDVCVDRLPATIEATAYFVVAEALTNVAKHARARKAAVSARVEDDTLRVEVRDDGIGGARTGGSGLVGLRDRLAALGGRLRVHSPDGRGTLVVAHIPLHNRFAD
ncbi:GAF domain-containing protein [Solirubrobacter ginsenosidimutans]|nr:GAF domain-containing protein [Solirubrobacter ginsenosidimutans]